MMTCAKSTVNEVRALENIPAYAVVIRDTKYVRGGKEDSVFYHYNLNLFALKIIKRSSFICNMDRETLKGIDTLLDKNIITNFSISIS